MRARRSAGLLLGCLASAAAHPLCLDDSGPSANKQQQLSFCSSIKDPANTKGSCCDAGREQSIKATLYDSVLAGKTVSDNCKNLLAQIACGECNPYAQHLFDRGLDKPTLCPDFCRQYTDACPEIVPPDTAKAFCNKYAADLYYCYPVKDQPAGLKAGQSQLQPYFPKLTGRLPKNMIAMLQVPGREKLWIVDQAGQIFEVDHSSAANAITCVLDISWKVKFHDEMGLIGLVFSPDYATTGKFYVHYTDYQDNSNIVRFTKNPDIGMTNGSETGLLRVWQWQPNHNGGTLLFSPGDIANPTAAYHDLYIAFGDGGSANDPNNFAQRMDSWMGKILRIRLSTAPGATGYTIPGDNMSGEIWAYGFRNPFKCSFDKTSRDVPLMYCGDVGQDRVERVIRVAPGKNHGWRNYEGSRYNNGIGPVLTDFQLPAYEYCHVNVYDGPCANKPFTGQCVTGGYVYRGNQYADLYKDQYIFADYQVGHIIRMYLLAGSTDKYDAEVITSAPFQISALAEDAQGELFIIGYGDSNSMVWKLPAQRS